MQFFVNKETNIHDTDYSKWDSYVIVYIISEIFCYTIYDIHKETNLPNNTFPSTHIPVFKQLKTVFMYT